MEMAKSLFGRDHDGYVGKAEHTKKLQTLNSEEDMFEELPTLMEEVNVMDGLRPSMWPQDILAKLGQPDAESVVGPNDQPDHRFDEFGFRVKQPIMRL
ncbi:uncharacterized protein ACN2A1_015222 isoform 1-T1 [Glossina fuscipes fuscipes]